LLLCDGADAAAESMTWVGAHVHGHEVRKFVPCAGQGRYWLSAPSLRDRQLAAYVDADAGVPYAPVYLLFEGVPDTGPRPGFAAGPDGMLRVARIVGIAEMLPPDCSRGGK
jgi:hypothetical protein